MLDDPRSFGYSLGVATARTAAKAGLNGSDKQGAARRSSSKAPKKTSAATKVPPAPIEYRASLFSSGLLPPGLAEAVQDLEEAVKRPVWLCIQRGPAAQASLGPEVLNMFRTVRTQLAADGPIALVLESPGGYAEDAYRLARFLRHHATGFAAIVPTYAKSAATLLALGADEIVMGTDAEMGPLDAQLWDNEREERSSALDEVQALERLHSVALEQLDETMLTMLGGMRKRTEVLLPIACGFVAEMMVPLLDKIDTVHYAKQSRVLKVAQDYAERLLAPRYPAMRARQIADTLVNQYPEHGFVIDREEMGSLLQRDLEPSVQADDAINRIDECLCQNPPFVAIGRLEEAK